MKKGFALLETIIAITFLAVSLLLLYGTFSNVLNNSKKNILYDDIANIYKTYYIKEYLQQYGLINKITENKITSITCNDFSSSGCEKLLENFKISKMYIVKKDIKGYDDTLYDSGLNNYLNTLSNNIKADNRLVVLFEENNITNYANIEINGDKDE